jgi:hypothetical protein
LDRIYRIDRMGEGGQRGQKWVPWRGTFGKSDFHAVEKWHNLGSMAWKIAEFDFHGVEVFGEMAGRRNNEGKTMTPRAGGEKRGEGRVWLENGAEVGV